MIEIFSQDVSAMQNIYAPLPMSVHFVFCIIATLIYLAQYARKGSVHYLLIMAAVDATFITQITSSDIAVSCLFAVEVVLLVCAGVFSHKFNKKQKALEAAKLAEKYENEEIDLSKE